MANYFIVKIIVGFFLSMLPLVITNDYYDYSEDYELTDDVLCKILIFFF